MSKKQWIIAQLDVVVWSEFPDTQRKTTVSSRFSSVVHKVENHTKSPRSLSNTGFAGVCMRGGQMVVKVVNLAGERTSGAGKAVDWSHEGDGCLSGICSLVGLLGTAGLVRQ